jgi:hypothetical protein
MQLFLHIQIAQVNSVLQYLSISHFQVRNNVNSVLQYFHQTEVNFISYISYFAVAFHV